MGTYGMYKALKMRAVDQRRKALLVLACLIFVLYLVQRFFMFRDEVFLETFGSGPKDLLIQLLPFQLCYVSLMLSVFGLWRNQKHILAFCFYVGVFGAAMAMISPDGYYLDKSLFHMPILFFYLLHGLLVCLYCNIGFLGLFPLNWKEGNVSIGILVLISGCMHVVNLVGRYAGFSNINYIYTLDPGGSPLLEMVWNWIPVPFLYAAIPGGFVFWAWAMFLTAVYKRFGSVLRKF